MTRPWQNLPVRLLCAGFLLCVSLVGCGDTCFVITGIFPEMSPSNPPSCTLGTGSGTVNVHVNSEPASSDAPIAPNLQHIFVTLRGIDAHPSALATEDSPDWQKLAPELENQPVQIDLMASPSLDAKACARGWIARASVRADMYRQVRLRLLSNQPASDEPVPQHNNCAGAGFNCVVAKNGQTYPLALENDGHELRIASDRIAGGSFNVLPDTEIQISIAFNPFASLAVPAGDAVQIAPIFSMDSAGSCNSPAPLQ
jgi:hypothetical protein